MRKIIATLIIASCSSVVFSQTQFTFSGKISGGADLHCIFMYTNSAGKSEKDSSILKDGKFSFKGNINGPLMGYFTLNTGSFEFKADEDPNTASIFLEPANMTVTGKYGHLKELKVTGSKSQAEYEQLQLQYAGLTKEYNIIAHDFDLVNAEYTKSKKDHGSDKTIDSLHERLEAVRNQYQNFLPKYLAADRQFILAHPSSYVSAFQLKIDQNQLSYDTVKTLFNKLSPAVQKGYDGTEIQKTLTEIENSSPGKKAKDFKTVDINGKTLNLSDFKGRVVLLDFWASWCVPCRASTPHLIELYKKYNKSGLEIIAIADDDHAKDAWIKAITQDSSALWHNVLRGFHTGREEDDLSNKFAVHSLPTRILIDQNGIIIARYTGTEDADVMDKKLAEIFK